MWHDMEVVLRVEHTEKRCFAPMKIYAYENTSVKLTPYHLVTLCGDIELFTCLVAIHYLNLRWHILHRAIKNKVARNSVQALI